MENFRSILVVALFIGTGWCGELTINYSPASLRFGSGSSIPTSQLEDVFIATLGFTAKESPWKGLTLVNPFQPATAVVVVSMNTGGLEVRQEGSTYPLKEDSGIHAVYESLTQTVSKRTDKPTCFRHFVADSDDSSSSLLPSTVSLNASFLVDRNFLKEIDQLPDFIRKVKPSSAVNRGGRDVVFIELTALAPLVYYHGLSSPQVREAGSLVRRAVVEVESAARQLYGKRVVVASVTFEDDVARVKRSLLKFESFRTDTETSLNVGAEYSEEFPVIFNIILWLFLLLTIALVAISMSMAYMDPGRDSIIYRMTNPRMKKDN